MGGHKFLFVLATALTAHVIGASGLLCPIDSNCVCGGTIALELNCDINGNEIKISVLPNTYLTIYCANARDIDYNKLPKLNGNESNSFKSVIFKECPLPMTSFKEVLSKIGVTKTMSLIFQNSKNLSTNLDKRQFAGLSDLSKLLLSVNGITYLPDNLFEDMSNLTWLNIRSNGISLSQNLFKPLERLETLEISHNHMANISGNLFSHLAFLRKLSLWQSNVTKFSKDLFTGVNVLEELDLSSNGLNELPSSIFAPLRKLKKLTLFSNKLSSLPSNLFKNNEELDTIIIFNNDVELKYLPKSIFSSLINLKEVYVQRCGLESIPSDAFIDSPLITNISLAYNEIEKLPESVFNDQINLLDLDLSHNKLESLQPKLFSSLVKLERLKLGYNLLKDISSFSSLLSLTYFDIQHNKLEVISPDMFNNNKQRMWINMAFNRLNFEYNAISDNESKPHTTLLKSPLAHLYHLKMLNLSHNDIKNTYEDWWLNGHENVDISFNKLKILNNNKDISNLLYNKDSKIVSHKTNTKLVWISRNPLACNCNNYLFISAIQQQRIKVGDIDVLKCSFFLKIACDRTVSKLMVNDFNSYFIMILAISFLIIVTMVTIILCLLKHKSKMYMIVKKFCYEYNNGIDITNENQRDVIIAYTDKDEDFVITELFPALKCQRHLNIYTHVVNKHSHNVISVANFMDDCEETSVLVIILTTSYLNFIQNENDIINIYGDALNNNNIIFVVVSDLSCDVSLNPFLNEQLINMKRCLTWREPDFWNKFLNLLPSKKSGNFTTVDIANIKNKSHDLNNIHNTPKDQLSTNDLPL